VCLGFNLLSFGDNAPSKKTVSGQGLILYLELKIFENLVFRFSDFIISTKKMDIKKAIAFSK
jgi:hypothetical protein